MRTFIAIRCFEDLRQLTVCSICFSISADQPSLTVHSAINTVYFSTLWATVCRVKWHWNQHLIATLGMRLIAHESMSSAMLSAVRKSPSAISTQVMSSYCPIYLLTLTKGYRGEANNERLWERERFVFQIKRIHSGFFMRSKPFLHFRLSCIAMQAASTDKRLTLRTVISPYMLSLSISDFVFLFRFFRFCRFYQFNSNQSCRRFNHRKCGLLHLSVMYFKH